MGKERRGAWERGGQVGETPDKTRRRRSRREAAPPGAASRSWAGCRAFRSGEPGSLPQAYARHGRKATSQMEAQRPRQLGLLRGESLWEEVWEACRWDSGGLNREGGRPGDTACASPCSTRCLELTSHNSPGLCLGRSWAFPTLPITRSFCIEAALGPPSRTPKETARVHLCGKGVGLTAGFTARVVVKIK